MKACGCFADGMESFEAHCVRGITAKRKRIAELLERR